MTDQPHRRPSLGSQAQVVALLLAVVGVSVLVALALVEWLEHAA